MTDFAWYRGAVLAAKAWNDVLARDPNVRPQAYQLRRVLHDYEWDWNPTNALIAQSIIGHFGFDNHLKVIEYEGKVRTMYREGSHPNTSAHKSEALETRLLQMEGKA